MPEEGMKLAAVSESAFYRMPAQAPVVC